MQIALLLDTCALIWIALGQPIDSRARAVVNAATGEGGGLRVSPISAWELGLLSAKGRLPSTRPPLALFNEVTATAGVRIEPLSPHILVQSSFLPGNIHSDPADRIILATAREQRLTIITRDHRILAYAKAGHVRALAC